MPSRYRPRQLQMAVRRMDEKVRRASNEALDRQAESDKAQLTAWTLGWKGKPKFATRRYGQVTTLGFILYTSGEMGTIFTYVDQGTGQYAPGGSPYIIRPKKAKALSFNVGYNARTQPVAKANVGTGRSSGERVITQQVIHPGIKPREFSSELAKRARVKLLQRIRERLSR